MSGYKPTFVEDILIDAKILEKCKNDLQCAIDATLTGLVDVGISTQNKLSKIKNDAVLAGIILLLQIMLSLYSFIFLFEFLFLFYSLKQKNHLKSYLKSP